MACNANPHPAYPSLAAQAIKVVMSEILLVNGRITTLDDVNSQADSILLRNGKVESVGDRIKVSAMASAGVTRIDLGGRRVIPACTIAISI